MTFLDFAQSLGLILNHPIADGRWHRTPTVDHPRRRNGAYAFSGDHGAAQNWAMMDNVATWRENGSQPVRRQVSATDPRKRWESARKEAVTLLNECERLPHPYLERKGFPDFLGLVHPSGDLLVPMRDHRDYEFINSVQRIDADGNKKFLRGGKAKGSVFRMGTRGPAWLVEGFVTGLSVQAALADLRQVARVLVCFSAGNLTYVAQFVKPPAFVFADNDQSMTGQKAAITTGFPYCMANIGDANDLHLAEGLRKVCYLMLDLQNSIEYAT